MFAISLHKHATKKIDTCEDYKLRLLCTILTSPFAPYVVPACLWVLAWCLQELFSSFVAAPIGLDVIYFTLGARVFSLLIFGLRGLIGLTLGSFITVFFLPSAQYPDPAWFLLTYTAVQSIFIYAIIKLFQRIYFDKQSLRGLSMKALFGIVACSSVSVPMIHAVLFRTIKPNPILYDFTTSAYLMQSASRIVGGMLFLLLLMLIGRVLLSRYDHTISGNPGK